MGAAKKHKVDCNKNRGIIRGDSFDSSFASWFRMKNEISPKLNNKMYSKKTISDASYRIINHWAKIGLIDDDRENSQGWRRFSLVELVWMGLVGQLRQFGVSNEKILKTKKIILGDPRGKNSANYLFEYYITRAFTEKVPVDFLIFQDGFCEIVSQFELESSKNMGLLNENFILVSLNRILQNIFTKKDLKASSYFGVPLDKDELTLIEVLQNPSYKKIEITRKNGKTERIDATECTSTQRVIDIIKEHDYQKITAHVENGKIINIERTVKTRPSSH